jgi:hypothetical protein
MMNKNDIENRIKSFMLPMLTDAVEEQVIHHWAADVRYRREEEDDGSLIDQVVLEYEGNTYTIDWAPLYLTMRKMVENKDVNPHLRYMIGKVMYQDEEWNDYLVDVIIRYHVTGKVL